MHTKQQEHLYLYNTHDYNKLSYNNNTKLELTQMKHKK